MVDRAAAPVHRESQVQLGTGDLPTRLDNPVRGLLRSGVVMRGGALAILVGLVLLPSVAGAAILKGPYLQEVSTSAIKVLVHTNEASATVQYGPDSNYGQSVTAGAPQSGVVQLAITGLNSSSVYHYRVTTPGGSASADYSFLTAPLPGQPFAFVAYGDNRNENFILDQICIPGVGGHNCHHQNVVDAILTVAPDFLVNTGDLVYDGDEEDLWQNFFNIEKNLLATTPVSPGQGNHDDTMFETYFPVTQSNNATSLYYSYDYGNAHFLVVDTEGTFSPGSPQYKFIDQDLAAHANKGPLIVFFHRPVISWGGHGTSDDVRTTLAPLFQKYGVDLVFQGHDHLYGRSNIYSGVTYVVTGGGGANLSPILSQLGLAKGAPLLNYVYVQVVGDLITAQARRPDGAVIDGFSVDAKANDGKFNENSPLPPDVNTGDEILDKGGCTAVIPGAPAAVAPALFVLTAGFFLGRRRRS